jgi:hypothetical protein
VWSWDSKSVLKSGFTPDKLLPPRTAGTLLSSVRAYLMFVCAYNHIHPPNQNDHKAVISDVQLLGCTSRSASCILPTSVIDKVFKGAICTHMTSLLRIKNLSPNQLRRLPPPLTDEEVERFDNNDDGTVLCTPKNFRIDFSRSWKTFQFNQASCDVFVAHFLKCVENRFYETFDLLPEYLTEEKVGIALDAHVDYIHHGYKKLDEPPTRPRDAELKAQAQNSRKDTVGHLSELA